jgi:anti-sigma28 factor (negative regulator of flagellin synthesis)
MSYENSSENKDIGGITEEELRAQLHKRPRSPTLLNLSWLRERLLKMQAIKERVESGTYDVDPQKTAKAMLGKPS